MITSDKTMIRHAYFYKGACVVLHISASRQSLKRSSISETRKMQYHPTILHRKCLRERFKRGSQQSSVQGSQSTRRNSTWPSIFYFNRPKFSSKGNNNI